MPHATLWRLARSRCETPHAFRTRVPHTTQVVRSLSACQGALLLVDATQGVQAQTLSTAKTAQAAGLKLVPVVTKIDLHHANVDVRDAIVFGAVTTPTLLTSEKM